MNILNWQQTWHLEQCDGEWEHEYGVKIETLDNSWIGYSVKNQKFEGSGDPEKLAAILEQFKSIWESNTEIQ
ncbi:MAG: hypothetical protein JST68_07650 [Bacteroidetes bacterium]|nr:hypothetical protein [Bacteroidota bacterium]